MAVDTENGFSGPFIPNGATTVFPFTFTAPSAAEVSVFLRAADGTETDAAGFTVTLTPGGGGNVTFAVAPPAGPELYILLAPNFTQDVQFENGSAWLAEPVNEVADRAAARDQAMKREIDRSLRVPLGETPPEGGSFAGNLTGKAIGFVNGKMVPVPNDASSAAQLVADVEVIAAEVSADQEQVGADRLAVTLAKQAAEQSVTDAAGFADDAESAAIAAAAAGKKFTSTALGIAGTSNGDYFVTPVAGGLAIWENVAGVATAWPAAAPDQKVIATSEALATAVAAVVSGAATVGIETGSTQSRGGIGGVEKGGVKLRATTYFDVAVKAQVANEFLSLPQMLMRRTVHMSGHSAVAASGAVAGATVNPRSGLNGGPARSLESVLRQISPDWRVIARGTSAQTGPNIAQRTGGLPTLITLDGGATTLAAAGAVGCTCSPDSGPSMRRGQAVESYYGKVNGAPCILKCTGGPNANSPVYTIEQLNGTATIPLTPGTAFFLNADLLDYAINIFWMTQNDPVVQVSIDAVAAAVGKLPKPSRYIIIGDWPQAISLDGVSGNGSQDIGTDPHNRMLQKNAILREQYGADFLDPYALFRNEYPYNGAMYRSLTQFTGEDDTQSSYNYVTPEAGDWRARGLLPRRWMGVHEGGVDYSHGNSQFYQQISFASRDLHMRPKGWLDL